MAKLPPEKEAERVRKIKEALKRKRESDPEWIERRAEAMRKARRTPESRAKSSQVMKNTWATKYDEMCQIQKEIRNTPKMKEKYRQKMIENWQNEEFRNKCFSSFNNNDHSKDTSIEIKVKEQLDALGIKYESQVLFFGHFFADIYIPSMKLIIECNGDYWHSLPRRIQRDKDFQAKVDESEYSIVWVWEHDIKQNNFDISKYLEEVA